MAAGGRKPGHRWACREHLKRELVIEGYAPSQLKLPNEPRIEPSGRDPDA